MIDLESMVKDILETDYSIEEKIESAAEGKIAEAIDRWMRNHDFNNYIVDAVESKLDTRSVGVAIEFSIEEFVENAI